LPSNAHRPLTTSGFRDRTDAGCRQTRSSASRTLLDPKLLLSGATLLRHGCLYLATTLQDCLLLTATLLCYRCLLLVTTRYPWLQVTNNCLDSSRHRRRHVALLLAASLLCCCLLLHSTLLHWLQVATYYLQSSSRLRRHGATGRVHG
jgi:hypothetical protein